MTQNRKNLYLSLLALVLFGGLVVAQQSAEVTQASGASASSSEAAADAEAADTAIQSTATAVPATEQQVEQNASLDQVEPDSRPREDEEEIEEAASTEGLISNATMEVFVPSEEISEDRSVSYPNDI